MTATLLTCWGTLVQREPAALAVIDGSTGRRWSRAELAAVSDEWSRSVAAGHNLAGRRVLVAEPNGARWFHVFLGLLRLGAIPIPADSTEPAGALAEQARGLRAAALWHAGALHPFSGATRHRRHNLCLFKLTSGSTGVPKALPFTHTQMLADGRQVCASMGIASGDLNLAVIPLGHSYGLGNLVVPLLEQGTPLVCVASPLPQALAADIARWRPTVFPAVPTLLRALVRSEIAPAQFASLRLVISAGAALPAELAAEFVAKFDRRIHNFYGASETGGICYDRTGEATLTGRSVGAPMEGVRLRFRAGHRFTIESAAVGGTGRFSPADRGMLDAAGELVLLGRAGRTVKIAGRRLDLAEVEHALLAIPGVRAACVLSHPQRTDALAAAVASDRSGAELRAQLQARLAPWKIPAHILSRPDLPVTERGKTDRRAVEKLLAPGSG
ncbi:MAG TPA: class I adenylate-forming enzyme family protein [Opitutaceae bacterium]|nr:class I adenylate-forming enzyme family protein [Opitutaceae bacterium]